MKKLSQLAFLICFLTVVGFATSCLAIQSLPDGWWLQDSPEKVLAKAQSINQDVAFFHGEKFSSPFSQITDPFAKTNDNARVEFFQRRNEGFVETKEFTLNGNFQETVYKLKGGDYVFTFGQL